MKKTLWISVLLCAMFAACKPHQTRLVVYNGQTQGGTFHMKYYAGADSLAIQQSIDSLLRVISSTASVFDSTSIISKVNNNQPVELNQHFINLFNKAVEVSKASQGCFDFTVGPLVRAWGFWRKKGINPTPKQVDSLRAFVGYQTVKIENGKVIKQFPQSMLDFNAIAQGYTVDVLCDYLMSRNCNDFVVEVGGEVRAHGFKNKTENWLVGIEKPAIDPNDNQTIQEKVTLKNKAMATSGNYRKFFIKDGKKYPHSINPFTGYPVTHSMLSVTVLANDCTTADAYGTVFMVLGLQKSKEFIKTHPGFEAYYIYADSLGYNKTEFTQGFQSMIVK
ncbi:MAG: FAD:protein FMN transferase [Bacteroidota bacterium]